MVVRVMLPEDLELVPNENHRRFRIAKILLAWSLNAQSKCYKDDNCVQCQAVRNDLVWQHAPSGRWYGKNI